MSIKVPNGAELRILQKLIDELLEGGTLHLFKNNYTPVDGSVIGDFTEADFDGYAPQTVTGWLAAYTNGSGKAETAAGVWTWWKTAGATSNTIYGWFYKDVNGDLYDCERNPGGGVLINTDGQFFSVDMFKTLKSEF